MSYSAAIAANSLIQRAFKESRPDVTPMKVQKLLWFLNGWHLAVTGNPAISEPFEAWKYGPVVSSVYHDLKKYGGGRVTEYIKTFDRETESFKAFVPSKEDEEFQQVLDLTWEKYIGIDATRLSAMTHFPNSPWSIAHNEGVTVINNELIKRYFIGLARNA